MFISAHLFLVDNGDIHAAMLMQPYQNKLFAQTNNFKANGLHSLCVFIIVLSL